MFRMLLMPVLVLAGACGAPTPPPPGMGSIELGTTALDGSGFLPLEGDQTLVEGAQGGFHIWLKYRVSGMPPVEVAVHREVRRVSDDKLILTTDGTQVLGQPGADGAWELPTALPSFMCPTPIGVSVDGEPVHFDVTIRSMAGELYGEGTAVATPHCPSGDEQAFCQNICRG